MRTQLRTLVRVAAAALSFGLLAAFASPRGLVSGASILRDSCDYCEDGESPAGFGHSFQAPGAFMDCIGYDGYAPCHVQWAPGTCGASHDGCIGSLPMRDDGKRVALSVEGVGTIIDAGDPRAIARLLADHPTAVQYNPAREVVQVIGCSGNIVAQFPVTNETAAALN